MTEFGFSCWTYFGINRVWDTLAKDYFDLGLNMPLTPVFNEGDDPEKLLRLLDRFHALGMKAIVFDNQVTARGGMTLNEALVACTLNGAWSIGMQDRIGSLEAGKQADLLLLDGETPAALAYHAGVSAVSAVYKKGVLVAGA